MGMKEELILKKLQEYEPTDEASVNWGVKARENLEKINYSKEAITLAFSTFAYYLAECKKNGYWKSHFSTWEEYLKHSGVENIIREFI